MFTPMVLLGIAQESERKYEALCVQFPAGTINDERNDARRLMEQALACAQWMEASGHKELTYVGPFGALPFKRKSRVRIRKGALVHSLHPNSKGTAPSKTSLVVKAHFVDPGFVDARAPASECVRQPRVTWAGAGGYWRSADANDVELVVEAAVEAAAADALTLTD